MGSHPVNLALRFVLELVALASIGYWGWTQHSGLWRGVLGIGLPVLAMVVWGTFRVPDDPGVPPVAVPGIVRLLLELAIFSLAVALLYLAGKAAYAGIFALIVLLHYAASYDRVHWLLTER